MYAHLLPCGHSGAYKTVANNGKQLAMGCYLYGCWQPRFVFLLNYIDFFLDCLFVYNIVGAVQTGFKNIIFTGILLKQ